MRFSGQAERGQGLVEYALILILVVLVALIVFVLLGESIENLFNETINELLKAL